MEQAKEQLKGHIALSLDSNLELMFSLARSLMIHGTIDSTKEIYNKIDSITLAELSNVAKRYYLESNLAELVYDFES